MVRQKFPLNVPAYNSNPSATATIYLDFDGDFTATWGTYHPGTTPAYDTDGDPTTFTADELVNIQQIFLGISEEFSAFNVNVTTVNPGPSCHCKSSTSAKFLIRSRVRMADIEKKLRVEN